MHSVLLVDDELNILSGLKVIISWERLGCKIVGTALNGVEGYELALRLKPEIIVTDIKMPYLDGLQMITRLKAAACPAHYIVLSGYSEFEYAKKGIELGVNDYILKPVEEVELEECLRKITAAIEISRKKNAEMEHLRKIADQNRENLRQLVLRDIIDAGSENPESLRELLMMIDFPVAAAQYVSLLAEFGPEGGWEEELTPKFTATIREVMGESCRVDVFAYSATQFGLILSMVYSIDAANFTKKLDQIRSGLTRHGRGDLTIGAGEIYTAITGISKSFEEARYALGYQIIKGKNRVIIYDEVAKYLKRWGKYR
jgi:two-component system response regulator YesN